LYLDHPQFEGFEVRQSVGRSKAEVATRTPNGAQASAISDG
jgi:hypothetical protein